MFHTADAEEAKRMHADLGGYLLDLGSLLQSGERTEALPLAGSRPQHVAWPHIYAVCSRAEALELGREPRQLDSLAPTFRELM